MAIQAFGPLHRPGESRLTARAVTRELTVAVAIGLRVLLVLTMVRVLVDPGWAHLEGKAPVARAILFPLLTLAVPAFWRLTRTPATYPWGVDVLVTLICFGDVLGNLLDLYDAVSWFDDWMHLANTAVVSAVLVVLSVRRPATFTEIANASLAGGLTASLAWELFEYGSFLTRTTEWTTAYSDTIGDLTLAWVGSMTTALVLTWAWGHRGTAR